MKQFVKQDSIVREIWGNADTILFVFAGSSAEFALNKAVDWLYFTGRLPSDPVARLFSTVSYARKILFSSHEEAVAAIDQVNAIHKGVETKRGESIPEWAYRDVLYMLIDYSIRSFEILNRKLTADEKNEVFNVFSSMGIRMGIKDIPSTYEAWEDSRKSHLEQHLAYSKFTGDLYKQYRRQLGPVRYVILKQVQQLLVPEQVSGLLPLGRFQLLGPALFTYKIFRFFRLDKMIKNIVLPEEYKPQFSALEIPGDSPISRSKKVDSSPLKHPLPAP